MDWTWILVFIGLMCVMHRFGLGCCGTHNHGGHDHEVDGQDPKTKPSRSSQKEELIGTGAVTGDEGEKRM
jgi:hypothetical protein